MLIRRGDIFYADLRPVVGSEQGKTSNPCGVRLHQVCTGEGFRCFTGTVAHNRQDAAER